MRELYQELIIDHGRRPRNFGALEAANLIKEGFNPLCGDRLTVYIDAPDGVIENIRFKGDGCAISMASASLMTEILRGKTIPEADALFENFHEMVTEHDETRDVSSLGKLVVLAGVSEFPARVKCATLAWHTVNAALHGIKDDVSTE